MFKFRSEPKANSAAPSVDDLRRQARHRLIGAVVLVVVSVVGFPMVFDTNPRPISADIPIVIPAQPALAPLTPAAPVVATPAPVEAVAAQAPAESSTPSPAPASPIKPAPPVTAPAANAAASAAPAAPADPSSGERYVVQVGAYADQARAREVRLKIERSGLKTYTQVAKTSEGTRIRVRLGPYNTRAEADKVAQKIKSLGLTPGVLTL
jgi:DedD protein